MDIESTYFHNFSIYREQKITNEFGQTLPSKFLQVQNLQNIPCAYSQSSRNSMNATQTTTTNRININPKIFCSPGIDVHAGDRVYIYYHGRLLGKFQTSETILYDSHQEIPILRIGEA